MDNQSDKNSNSSRDSGLEEVVTDANRPTRPDTLPLTDMNHVRPIEENNDTVDYRPFEGNAGSDVVDGTSPTNKSQNNPFSVRKNFAQGMCDTALMMANVSQLRAVIESGSDNRYFIPLLIMLSLSLSLQIFFVLAMIQKWRKERHAELHHYATHAKRCSTRSRSPNSSPGSQMSSPVTQCCTGVSCTEVNKICLCDQCKSVEWWDECSVFLMFPIILLNIGIAGLGISPPK